MASRHRSRERALQLIFQWEASGDAPDRVLHAYWGGLHDSLGDSNDREDVFAEQLFYGVAGRAKALDEVIRPHAANWRLERMSAVDRNILRLATYEMQQGEPPAIAIDEALELGRRFSGEKSAKFLNGVLDAVRKTISSTERPAPAE